MRWGLIGASRIAANHMIGAIRAIEGAEIAAVLSGDRARGEAFAREHGIGRACVELDALLDGVDAVYVSTTNEKHHPQTMAAIAAGKHVLCEKPLALTLVEAVEMTRAAETAGVVLATNHHLRNAGSHLAIREHIRTGAIGEVRSARVFHAVHLPEVLRGWRIDAPEAGGGVVLDITVHDADTVRFHLGEDPLEVVATAGVSGMGRGVEDSAMSLWTLPSGAMVQTHESFTHPFAGTGIEFHGSRGSIFAKGVMTQQPVGEIVLRDASGEREIAFDRHDLYERSVRSFAAAVAGEGEPAASGIDGVKSLAVALAVREAARTGAKTQVDYGGVA